MDVETLTYDRAEAHKLMLKYKTHRHYSNPVDAEVLRIYEAIAKGQLVVRALHSIRKAGVGGDGLPKLALARADAKECHLNMRQDGSARMMADLRMVNGKTRRDRYFDFEAGTFPPVNKYWDTHTAFVPHIPPDIRPRRGLQNYHVLFEAVWRREPPVDPMLLRRQGGLYGGDVWIVVGAWELTEVERAVMADRLIGRRRQ